MKLIAHNQQRMIQPASAKDALDQFFERSFWDPFGPFFSSRIDPAGSGLKMFIPHIDIFEDQKNLQIEASVPGYKPENIQVQVDEHTLILKGKMEEEKSIENKKYYRRERSFGEFYREITLPTTADVSKATCKNNHGVLTISMPKLDAKERKNLKIET